jgi:hypothetical protein
MNTQLEQDLRHAMAAQAAELPANVSRELLARDYRPRGSVGRAALALALVTLAAAAAFAVSVIGLGSDAPRAFAGWTTTPTAATSDQVSRAGATCRSQLARIGRLERTRESRPGSPSPLSIPSLPPGGWHTVLVDTRGPYTLILFERGAGRATSVCFTGSRVEGVLGASIGASIGARPPARVPSRRVTYASSGSTSTPPNEGSRQFSWVVGRTGPGVTGVTIRLNSGTGVTASRAKGWFLAWWPGSHGIRATEVATAGGTEDR